MEKLEQLIATVTQARSEGEKFFDKENSAAGTRLRKQLQEVVTLAKELRKEVTEVKATRKAQA
jgi:hypothetical protein